MNRTAIAYDSFNLRHTQAGHPENYLRLEQTWGLLQSDGILENLIRVPGGPAPMDAVLRVHTRQYVEHLRSIALTGGGRLDADTYVNVDSYEAAMLAAGGVINVVDMVLDGKASNGFALVRPPGHHALPHWGMGFCLLANAAIAARWAQERRGIGRILIVDFDVHHGNGTQDVFYSDPSILFFSTHQFPYYPGTGSATETGTGKAEGTIINVPFSPHVGDEGYLAAFKHLLAPAARAFKPELILLSAGFDAHWLDPLSSMKLSVTGYSKLVESVMELAEDLCCGRLACVLEGGYHLEVLAHCILSTLRLLSGSRRGVSDPFGPAPDGERDVGSLLEGLCDLHNIAAPPFYSVSD